MTPELERLLSRDVVKDDDDLAFLTLNRLSELANMDDWVPGWNGEVMKPALAVYRRTIVLATLKEAAKLVCHWCACGDSIRYIPGVSRRHDTPHGEKVCAADPIHAAIAAAEAE